MTPVCAASITTGVGPDEHLIPSMNWYHREEARYVEYGSSFSASRQFGVLRSLTDTVYRMNAEHLSKDVETVFERLDDADARTAGTTYLIYRGRHPHEVSNETALARIATSTLFRRTIDGPRELFYADLYASRKTGCRGQLGMPGIRDQHTGCVGAYLVEHDLFDFLLFSLPDNDAWSHKNGPHAQVTSIAAADRQLERLMHAAGGPDAFFEDHAVIVASDHSQAPVEERIRLDEAFARFRRGHPEPGAVDRRRDRAQPSPAIGDGLRARCRSPRTGAGARRRGSRAPREAWIWSCGSRPATRPSCRARAASCASPRAASCRTAARLSWSVEGEPATLAAELTDGRFTSYEYPDALARIWSALHCERAGDVLLSAAPSYEFVDWGGADHVGGGSHGSLHHSDSLGALLWCGTGPASRDAREQWSLRDIVPMVREHFGV